MPLVLHGCSDIPDDQLKESVNLGLSKFNIATEYDRAFYAAIAARADKTEQKGSFSGFREEAAKDIRALCGRKAEASESQRLCPVKVVTEYAFLT